MKTTHQLKKALENGTPRTRNAVAAEVLANIDAHLPWFCARELSGITIKRKPNEWLVVVKAMKGMKHEVAFMAGETIEEAIYALVYSVAFDLMRWREDKYTTMRSDKKE